jgi:hypothetical protein
MAPPASTRAIRRAVWLIATIVVLLLTATPAVASPRTWMNISGCAAPAGGAANQPVWAQHPAAIGGTCDGTAVFVAARWRDWGQTTAAATATLNLATSCTPNCATAPRHRYAVTIVATNIERCGTRRIYSKITARYTHPRTRLQRKPISLYAGCGTAQ